MCDEFESLVRDTLRWHQDTYRHFPLDPSRENSVRFMVRGALFSRVRPTPFRSAVRLAAASPAALRLLDLGPEIGANSHFVDIVAGNDAVPGVPSLAHRYGGHQFGFWAEQLGDGRAHLIGEYTNSGGERWELQLKGSGRTPYSRYGDGRAVVRSSVREFLCSEAMHYLGVPTSRAATLVISDDRVVRDAFYDGRPVAERAAVVLRLAPCWFRFGSFEMLATDGDTENLRLLADYWCGFAHGVMNTDNMSILSITIDYGPFGFLDAYEPDFVPNHSDDMGRYSYGNQERVGRWNIEKLGAALRPLLPAEQAGQLGTALDAYTEAFAAEWRAKFSARLGLPASAEAEQLARRLLTLMERTGADFTMTFRQLGDVTQEQLKDGQLPDDMWALRTAAESARLEGVGRRRAIADAEKGEFAELQTLLAVLERPFDEQPDAEERGFAGRPPDWAARLMVSCSS
ncbi:UPF0061 protein [Amphibalanus amphitrite]|uniref:Selenoprotein O n=1 Tax=Amphibalanus amphitrite TaxID=1232801 RepID=A0A6A4VM78_AMPAM|nr:UPF0061 protein [Amphibalanus amphitrite]KAF0295726.1 UPF0061 protein [Amphibalanus amphitrite]KAF0295727.1 UPF0061 protein [Amphibalanus amphitrite]